MSIAPVSDIVLDVARAADPGKTQAATERLARLGGTLPAADGFAGVMASRDAGDGQLRSQLAMIGDRPAFAPAAAGDARAKAYKGVEELVLQRLVEAMLPNEDSGFFGAGAAGDIWRSMLAEQLARQIGKTVDLGLGKAASPIPAAADNAGAGSAAAAPGRRS